MYSEYEIFGTNQQMRKVIEQACERLMETYGLRHVELDILYLISHEKQKDTAKDLIEIQHLSKAHISKSVDNLKQHGYIELIADEADHRKIHIRMTGKARPVMNPGCIGPSPRRTYGVITLEDGRVDCAALRL